MDPEETTNPQNVAHTTPEVPEGLPRIRTYAEDLNEEIKKKGETLSSIVGAERERSAQELANEELDIPAPRQPMSSATKIMIAGIALFIILGAGAIGAAYYLMSPAPQVSTRDSIIFPNKLVPVDVSERQTLTDQLAITRNNTTLSLGEIGELDVTLAGATTTADVLLTQMNAPDGLIREAQGMMIGIHSFDHNQPFLIIKITQYDRAFGAMLGWEEDMGRSLGNFFRPLNGTVPPTTQFTDKVFRNVDERVSQAEWPIVYAFPRRDILVITTNEQTLLEIMTRLAATPAQ